MRLTKNQVQDAIELVGGRPIFKGNDNYLFHEQIICTGEIETLEHLIHSVFAAGMDYKISELKKILNINDPNR
jgi:hypothetical protein